MAKDGGEIFKMKYKFSYDKEQDDLFVYSSKSKSKGSVEFGDVIIDLNSQKEFVGIQIMHASEFLQELVEVDIKPVLDSLKECRVETIRQKNMLIVKLFLVGDVEVSSVLSLPYVTEGSPAVCC